ncbi:MAG: hypothetical protein ACT6R7_14040 [Brevundimonas aurantiaca]|uniref:hypothetical protein n=1 Tax=Brevundimonas aurantiaca TaxID=74316 RepID=UPI0040340768
MLVVLAAMMMLQVNAPAARPAPVDDAATCPAVPVETNALRDWEDFEFSTDIPGSPMWYADRGCYRRAAQASREYLTRGPLLGIRESAISHLHMARYLAFAGDEAGAAQALAGARRSDQRAGTEIPLDWNAYVEGLYGFLVKDRGLLEVRLARLQASANQGDRYNGANLSWLSRCFERSYMEAQTEAVCAVEPSHP